MCRSSAQPWHALSFTRYDDSSQTVFEMGSAIGYSTIWWARAVGESGQVHYTDGSPKNAEKARSYFERAGVASRITVHTGDAIEFSEQKQQFDIVFNDIDKQDYPRVLRVVGPRVRKGGLFITDNTLWSAKPPRLPLLAIKPP